MDCKDKRVPVQEITDLVTALKGTGVSLVEVSVSSTVGDFTETTTFVFEPDDVEDDEELEGVVRIPHQGGMN